MRVAPLNLEVLPKNFTNFPETTRIGKHRLLPSSVQLFCCIPEDYLPPPPLSLSLSPSPPFLPFPYRFQSSNDPLSLTSLEEYLERMKEKQEHIYFMAAPNRQEAESSPFVERLLRKGYEVLYLVEPVDEYCIQVLGGGGMLKI